jgi:hypothetical protein
MNDLDLYRLVLDECFMREGSNKPDTDSDDTGDSECARLKKIEKPVE